jgi:hypothetical protein
MRPTGNIHRGIMAGKLKGAMPAHTPRGTLYEYVSMPFDTFSSVSPIKWLAAPHVVSTTSRPLQHACQQPKTSGKTFGDGVSRVQT